MDSIGVDDVIGYWYSIMGIGAGRSHTEGHNGTVV